MGSGYASVCCGDSLLAPAGHVFPRRPPLLVGRIRIVVHFPLERLNLLARPRVEVL
ncbi:hypothetical protein D3C85_1731000 [compost metagenome]